MAISDLLTWAEEIEAVRLPAAENQIEQLDVLTDSLQHQIAYLSLRLTDSLALHSVRIQANRDQANTAISRSTEALEVSTQISLALRQFTEEELEKFKSKLAGDIDQLGSGLRADFGELVEAEVNKKLADTQAAYDQALADIEAISRNLGLSYSSVISATEELLNTKIPKQDARIEVAVQNAAMAEAALASLLGDYDYPNLITGLDAAAVSASADKRAAEIAADASKQSEEAAATYSQQAATSRTRAGESADAAATKASLAETSAEGAAQSAAAANTSKLNAQTARSQAQQARNDATTAASNAASSAASAVSSSATAVEARNDASGAAAQAVTSSGEASSAAANASQSEAAASQSASLAVSVSNRGIGVLESQFFGNGWYTVGDGIKSRPNSRYPTGREYHFDLNNTDADYLRTNSKQSNWLGTKSAASYKVEFEYMLNSGTRHGAGIRVAYYHKDGSLRTDNLSLVDATDGQVDYGEVLTGSILSTRPSDWSNSDIDQVQVTFYANNSNYGTPNAKDLTLFRLQVYPATKTEAGVIQQSKAIADLEGNAASGYLVKAQAGSQVSLLELVAADGSNGSTSVAKISASSIILDGSIYGRHLRANTITADEIASGTITGTQIKSRSISADELAANSIRASNGHIANAAVGTLEIKGNAVTTTVYSVQEDDTTLYAVSNTYKTIGQITIDRESGFQTAFQFSIKMNSFVGSREDVTLDIKLERDSGSTIDRLDFKPVGFVAGNSFNYASQTFTACTADLGTGSGRTTYQLYARVSKENVIIDSVYIGAQQYKR